MASIEAILVAGNTDRPLNFPPSYRIRAANSTSDRRAADILVDKMYATRGYQTKSFSEDDICSAKKTFLASEHDAAVGTLTIGLDLADGINAEDLFPEEVAQFRAQGLGICEFTKLALDRRPRSACLLASLFHIAYIYAHKVKGLHHLLIEVNPRHVRYYEAMLGFKTVAAKRMNLRVNAPAVLLSLDLDHAERQIHKFGGRPELAAVERSAYPYFFSAVDEAAIVSRLQQQDEEIAEVYDCERINQCPPRAEGTLH